MVATDTRCPERLGPFEVAARVGIVVSAALKRDVIANEIAEQIATASRIMTLDPGDVLLTGTPAGVGVPKGTFLAVGDRVEASIEGIGTLAVTIQPAA